MKIQDRNMVIPAILCFMGSLLNGVVAHLASGVVAQLCFVFMVIWAFGGLIFALGALKK